MRSSKTSLSLGAYTIGHFIVDFACFYFLMGTFRLYRYTGIGEAKGFLLYNAIAFGLQFLVGWFYDGRNYRFAGVIGMLLVIAGIGLDAILPMVCEDPLVIEFQTIYGIAYSNWLIIILILLAFGNAFFHVAGGMDSLINSDGKMKRCGIFVSSGALGVAIGGYAGENSLLDEYAVIAALIIGMAFVWTYGDALRKGLTREAEKEAENLGLFLPAVLCFLAIAVRGCITTLLHVSFHVLFLTGAITCFGKAAGGVLADEFGGKVTGAVLLCVAAAIMILISAPRRERRRRPVMAGKKKGEEES